MAFRLAAKFACSGGIRSVLVLPPRRYLNSRLLSGEKSTNRGGAFLASAAVAACGAAAVYAEYRRRSAVTSASTTAAAAPAPGELPERALNWRERRFLAHASLQYDGIAYLTPLDFIESVVLTEDYSDETGSLAESAQVILHQSKPGKKRHKRRRVLAEADYHAMIRSTPGKRRASDHLFRDIGSNGLISYPEYLLLLNVLSKSSYGFAVAFRAFDRNSDGRLDAEEFQCLNRVVSGSSAPDSCSSELLAYGSNHSASATTLLVHFFGSNRRDSVSAAEFAQFADNLQREVLLIEFNASCGQTSTTMAPLDFARAVLRRTRLTGSERRLRLGLLEDRVWQSEGITAEEYRLFFQFLLHTDDLFLALRMFDIAGKSIDQDDFQRAVKAVSGQIVSPKLLTIVFALFDIDGDGALSFGEFLKLFGHQDSLLKNRRSLAGVEGDTWWDRYRKCVKKRTLLQQ